MALPAAYIAENIKSLLATSAVYSLKSTSPPFSIYVFILSCAFPLNSKANIEPIPPTSAATPAALAVVPNPPVI